MEGKKKKKTEKQVDEKRKKVKNDCRKIIR